jgi:hypothetical protein
VNILTADRTPDHIPMIVCGSFASGTLRTSVVGMRPVLGGTCSL